MTLPNLVIAGAPKCGTSSLFSWLADHPEVCGSSVKEPFFLMDRGHPLLRRDCNFHDHGLDAYASFFRGCGEHHRIAVEASTHYIYQATALDVLASLPTEPRILLLLRKPSERVFSSFVYSKAKGTLRGDLAFPDFVRLIREHPNGLEGKAWGASAYVLARDLQYSRYIEYLSRWRERLGADRIHVLLFESVRAGPKAVMKDLSGWLRLDPSFYDSYHFVARNRTQPVRSHGVQQLVRALAAKVPVGFVKESLKRLYYAVQRKGGSAPRTAADEAALAELDEEFRPFNEQLAREFGLDLDAWK